MTDSGSPLLSVDGLTIEIGAGEGHGTVVDDVSFEVRAGETVALVGESGSGKTLTSRAVLGLLPPSARVSAGSIVFQDRDLLGLPERDLRMVRGGRIGMVFQEPMTSLNPVMTIGAQVAEPFRIHLGMKRREALDAVRDLLAIVGLPRSDQLLREYPHTLSGGMRQRVVIAMAVACKPALVIADEPTTALDVTVQAQVMLLLGELSAAQQSATLLVSHDLALVSEYADRILVMKDGALVEQGRADSLLSSPRHEYTSRLLDAVPGRAPLVDAADRLAEADVLLAARNLTKTFPGGRRRDAGPAVADVSFELRRGETLALVGESGSGKSTTARMCMRLLTPTSGEVHVHGRNVTRASGRQLRELRRQVQMVFQDPYDSLDPRYSVERIIAEPLVALDGRAGGAAHRGRVDQLLEMVRLPAALRTRRAHELSGGQRQRVAIARALAPRPSILVCDEAVSSLDVSVQADILKLIAGLQRDLDLAVLFITHDLAVVRDISHRVAVMRQGRVVEIGSTATVFENPTDPYTRQLLAAAPALPSRSAVQR